MSAAINTDEQITPLPAPRPEPQRAAGAGWQADIYMDEVELTVTPEGDVLPKALSKLFTTHQLRYWTYAWDHEDDRGRDVYLITRCAPTLA